MTTFGLNTAPVPATITTTIEASDSRVTGGGALQFQGGTLAPVGAGVLALTNGVTVLASSTGTLDATSQDIASTGAVTIGGTSLTLSGSATSTISMSGDISGTGILINAGGNNSISGANTGGGLSITGGSLRIASVNSLATSGNSVTGEGTMVLPGDLIFSGTASIAGAGASGQAGALVFDGTGNTHFGQSALTVNLSGDARIALLGVQDYLLNGQIDASAPGATLTIDTGAARFFPDSGIGAGVAHVIKEGGGTLYVRANVVGDVLVNAGTYYAGVAAATGAGVTVNPGAALRLSSDYGTPVTFAAPLSLSGAGALSIISAAPINQAGQITLAGDSSITSLFADHTIAGGIVGATPGQNLTLEVYDRSLTLTGTIATSIAQVTKTGAGVLLVDSTGVIDSGSIVVSAGILADNGAINGNIAVTAGGTLGGSGTISGAVNVGGVLAPGNSPGLQTQLAGDTTLSPGARFQAQLGGTTAGNGDGHHDQYYVQSGRFILDPGVTLDVRSWVKADGSTVFVPSRRDVFTILRTSGGIAGVFSDLTNADYSQWVLFDNAPSLHALGKLYGTGLNGNQTFAAYGTTPAHGAVGASLWAAAVQTSASSIVAHPAGFLSGDNSLGVAAIALLSTADPDVILDRLSPEPYLAVGDYALTATRSVTDAAFAQSSLIRTGSLTIGAGYNRAEHGYVGATSPGYALSSDTTLVTAAFDLGPRSSVGFFYGQNHGKTIAAASRIDYRGGVFGLTYVGRIEGPNPVTIKGALVASDLRFEGDRTMEEPIGASSSGRRKVRTLGGQLTAAVELHKDGRLAFSPMLGYVQGRSTVSAFAEAGSGANLAVDAMVQESSRLVAGFGLNYLARTDLVFDVTAALEHEFSADAGRVAASFVGGLADVPMSMTRAIGDRDSTTFGLGAAWKLDNSTTVRLGGEVRGNRELRKDYRYNASVNVRF